MYCREGRFYHTLEHLRSMFRTLEEQSTRVSVERKDLVALAVFFHDAVYSATSATNEEDSTELFRQFSKQAGISESDSKTVCSWILMTADHHGTHAEGDAALFLDLDLAVLGARYPEYARCAPRCVYLYARCQYARCALMYLCVCVPESHSCLMRSHLRPAMNPSSVLHAACHGPSGIIFGSHNIHI